MLSQLASSWTSAGFAVRLPEDVMAWKYRKLLSNLTNALQALAGPAADVAALAEAAEREAREILDAAQISYTSDAEEQAARDDSFTGLGLSQPAPLGVRLHVRAAQQLVALGGLVVVEREPVQVAAR